MKKIVLYALFGVTLWAGVLENNYSREELKNIDNRSGEEIAKEYVNEKNKILPIQQDETTKIVEIIAINTKIYFKKEINKNKTTQNKKRLTLQEMYEDTRAELCKNPSNKAYLYIKNLGFQYDHYDSKTKQYIGSFSVDKSDCIKLEEEQKSKGKKTLY